jgi:hypothetical protein
MGGAVLGEAHGVVLLEHLRNNMNGAGEHMAKQL